MSKPEQSLWQRLKKNLPPKTHATRIENRAGSGVPDVHLAHDGNAVWVELKIAKANTVNMRPSQIAWNMAYSAAGGVSFILVSRPSKGDVFLFEGGAALRLAASGLADCSPVFHGTSLADCAACILRLGACESQDL